jgi:hypothetical protein
MRQCLGRIEGKFAAAAVMNHRGRVYRVGDLFAVVPNCLPTSRGMVGAAEV